MATNALNTAIEAAYIVQNAINNLSICFMLEPSKAIAIETGHALRTLALYGWTPNEVNVAVINSAFRTARKRQNKRAIGSGMTSRGWYYYSVATGCRAQRDSTLVADRLMDFAILAGYTEGTIRPTASWCPKWRRTKRSMEAEEQGVENIEDAINYLMSL